MKYEIQLIHDNGWKILKMDTQPIQVKQSHLEVSIKPSINFYMELDTMLSIQFLSHICFLILVSFFII